MPTQSHTPEKNITINFPYVHRFEYYATKKRDRKRTKIYRHERLNNRWDTNFRCVENELYFRKIPNYSFPTLHMFMGAL